MVGVQAEAAPGFGDDDAVAGVVGVVADLDGEIDADVADEFGEQGDVLGALVGDAGDAVGVDEDGGDALLVTLLAVLAVLAVLAGCTGDGDLGLAGGEAELAGIGSRRG